MQIPYVRYKTAEGHLESLPILSVRIACNRKHQQVWALIDSGADMCIFNSSIAQMLDVDIKSGREFQLNGLVGGSVSIWIHQVNLTVGELGSINTNAAFTEFEDTPSLCVLGQRGFFDNFQIRFQRYKNLIEIYPKSTSV